ncbi:MAG: amino acid ABC transporter permease [Anaerolineales bacterium]
MESEKPTSKHPGKSAIPIWRDERVLRIATQVISAVLVIAFLWWSIDNFLLAMQQRGMSMSFRFMQDSAGFPISESPIPYDPSRSFSYAFYVGILNTVRVASIGIVLTTILGVIVGIARLSTNWLVNRIALAFIEFHRNIPLLVLLFIWYFAVFLKLPRVEDSIQWLGSIYINQRGLYIPWLRFTEGSSIFLISLGIGIVLATIAWIWLSRIRVATGKPTYYGAVSMAILVIIPIIGWFLAGGNPVEIDPPILVGFNYRGGTHLTPEFTALLVGLFTYTAAFVAEVVRAGILAVSRGQIEAARAVGLNYIQILSLVIMPQAMRVIVPPLISQYLNLTKNSSLAFFIGYIDLFYVGRTTMNQAGRAVQVFLLVMAAYLLMSLLTSLVLNLYNRRIQFVER